MLRIPTLAWLLAAGLAALALTLFLMGEDAPVTLAAPVVRETPAVQSSAPEPRVAEVPELRASPQVQAALRATTERLERARKGRRTTLHQLARRPGWIRFLEAWLGLPATEDDAERLGRIQKTLEDAEGPVVRQNLIFLAALALPAEVAHPWLEALWRDGGADGEDAFAALAFSGHAAAREAFERLARDPAAAKVRRLLDYYRDHDVLARTNDDATRQILRSYRALECHMREPYFKMVAYVATRFRPSGSYGESLGWVQRDPLPPAEERRALEAWLARWPGHPGSDDMACRIAASFAREGNLMDAARWYSLASVLPDQDRAWGAARTLAGICEVDLEPEAVLTLSDDEGLATPNRRFFHYVYLRRTAAERGFAAGLDAARMLAREDPDGVIAAAWRGRFLASRPKGLGSGMTPLGEGDPISRQDGRGAPAWPKGRPGNEFAWSHFGFWTGGSDALRLHPWPEPVTLDRERLLRQLRAWEALDALERRAAKASGSARADLLYKQAAMLYHDRDVLYPAYGRHSYDFSGMMRSVERRYGTDSRQPESVVRKRERFETSSLAYVRAMRLFEQIEREHPTYPGMDKVLFSQGMLWRRLIDYRPSGHHVYWWKYPSDDNRRTMNALIDTFERLAKHHPDSPLTDDGLAAAAWWRRVLERGSPR